MAEAKTRPTGASVDDFIAGVDHPGRREDALLLRDLLGEVSGAPAVLWGTSIVGFGSYRGPTGDWPIIGFSPRKANMVVYIMTGFDDQAGLLARLGKHRTGGSCLYLGRLKDIDVGVLRDIAAHSVAEMRLRYPA